MDYSERIQALERFYSKHRRLPSYSEMLGLFGVRSKNAVAKIVGKLQADGVLGRDRAGRLVPKRLGHAVRVLGTVEAGFPSPAEEELADTISLDDFLVEKKESSFMLRVSGDSMAGAGIKPGDYVIVERGRMPKNGDIVVAEVDGEWTVKYFQKHGTSITLVPANPNFKPIKPKASLSVAGVVRSVVRKY